MRTFTYTSGVDPTTTVDLADPESIMIGQIRDLRTTGWNVDTDYRTVTSAIREAREAEATANCPSLEALDRAVMVFDADLAGLDNGQGRRTAGTLTVDGWTQKCLVPRVKPSITFHGFAQCDITFLLLDGVWRHDMDTLHYWPASTSGGAADLDLPTDMPFDLAGGAKIDTLVNTSLLPRPWRMTIFGPATNPSIVIGGNTHQIDVTIPAGGYLLIDAIDNEKQVLLVDQNGNRANVLDKARRGTGQGSGEYIFERIPAGTSALSWSNSFGFDLTVVEERSVPPWSN
ncbi:hypothetical protein BTIS_1110 [Bifidobacterium tissieri]|uniref:Uncharacterized protein n=1 Tax=Bifidobacterium tissieri TaxID=1630162 RepID=A0A261FFE6_9BIFI|nr:hypothetical protein [Bifidobacterium tissieri]OZG57869.1 hypothetical protein BTIS_1110 [Bifidobacterium tissieri]